MSELDESGWTNEPIPQTIPHPTAWPVAVALGVTLMAFGLVTSWVMSLSGFILTVIGAGGWIEDLRND